MINPITETDLLAYVDDQIDVARRIEIEDYLARNPEAAAQVMADLRTRDLLRLAMTEELQRPPEAMIEAARRLGRGLVWREFSLKLRRIAAVVALIGIGWFAHSQVGLFEITDSEASPKPPAFVEDALHSHQTAFLRARMASQPPVAEYNPSEIAAETGIALPPLPDDWRVADVQVFPSRDGHSIEMVIETKDLGHLSLFAAHVSSFHVIAPTIARFDSTKAAYWQMGQLAYALTGTANEGAMQRMASKLARTVH
ncbi:anti-sigma factor family protein [Microvirga lenta]|uniref:anti-sigma factor family protein n=1 Tax=Microvirga lenta TaxID=2881337 RepID=UPI001CFF6948|nr:anti-sigma factor [Microvirga lenta]MCB5177763.1 anti-sigma factor [Microvirga lenta]